MSETVDYDAIADRYDERYERREYEGVEAVLCDFVGADSSVRILEVGCGTGQWLGRLLARGFRAITGLDASSGMLERARKALPGVELVHGDAQRLPFDDATLDRVCSVNALHHFPDKRVFFAEARRVLRPGGGLVTFGLDPHTGRDRWTIYPDALELEHVGDLPLALVQPLERGASMPERAWFFGVGVSFGGLPGFGDEAAGKR